MNFSLDPFSEGLSFEDHLPCEIESRAEPPSLAARSAPERAERLAARNPRV